MPHTTLPVMAGLATGIGFIVLFAMLTSDFPILRVPSTGSSGQVSVVVIPEGASLASSGKTYEPQIITVVIGMNDTVRWVNQDETSHSVVSEYVDPVSGLFSSFVPQRQSGLIAPGESFEFTFTQPGTYDYYMVPHPHMQGTVIVLSP